MANPDFMEDTNESGMRLRVACANIGGRNRASGNAVNTGAPQSQGIEPGALRAGLANGGHRRRRASMPARRGPETVNFRWVLYPVADGGPYRTSASCQGVDFVLLRIRYARPWPG